jgi:hypothetical protein
MCRVDVKALRFLGRYEVKSREMNFHLRRWSAGEERSEE